MYRFEFHPFVDAIQMSTHNICFYKEIQKKEKNSHKHHQIMSFADLFFSVPLVGTYFTTRFPSNFEKHKCAVQ